MQATNWHDVYSNLSPKLLGICRRYIKDIATAEDIVQDSFIVAIQKECDLKNKEALKGWLSKIVINRAINHLKNENKLNTSSTENFEFIDDATEMNTLEIDKKSAILASDFSHEDLLEAIDSLSENHKTVFNLYIIDQFSHLEISELLKISVGTSKSSLSRARKNVQHFLLEKLNGNNTNEKKKRRIAFLLFLGFGNQLFANYYRNSFSTFEIEPKKPLDTSRNIVNSSDNYFTNSFKFSIYKKVAVSGLSVILLFFLLKIKGEKPVSKFEKPIEKEIKVVQNTIDTLEMEVLKKKPLVQHEEIIKNPVVQTTSVPTKVEPQIQESAGTKDSVSEKLPPKVVVIKKQIVVKDTVYVEK